eukprot:CAMPEP_0113945070 /NCGR_PEP_ID=MMETSP1339-20121228/38466_1 /TAXON_ID=94617 /ORGANISM="Fibrocapsa japonica" /LENGTH=116 /DNA_ID=CAMNT_0000950469 /DNA_START=303 /DNA_END=653 /DNA_ORIENTATION=- /assembly_acc=CAM_ASM_000762
MMDFCKAFNAQSEKHVKDVPIPVVLTAYEDRSFDIMLKTPQTSWLLKRCAGIEKGSARPGYEIAGQISLKQCYEIAKVKQTDEHLKLLPLEGIFRSVVAQAETTLGLEIVDDRKVA